MTRACSHRLPLGPVLLLALAVWPAAAQEDPPSRREEVREANRREDESRPDDRRTIWIGKTRLVYGGSFEIENKYEFDYDLHEPVDEDVGYLSLLADVELEFHFRPNLEAFAELKFYGRGDVLDEAGQVKTHSRVYPGENWLYARDLFGRGLGIKVGRQDFDDAREWLYDRNLDAVRFFLDREKFGLELSVSERLSNASERYKDITHYIAYASYEPRRRVFFDSYVIYSEDHSRVHQARDRDDSDPLWAGVRAYGRVLKSRLRYWTDIAWLGGDSVEISGSNGDARPVERDFDACAFDVGATWIFRKKKFRPNFTLGIAYGSGDSDPENDTDRQYRQTGLQDNSGKFYGKKSFRYYGEVLDPELSNLRVLTAGIGIRPPHDTSLDLVYHDYRQARRANRLRNTDLDARPLGISKQLGSGLDLVFGWKYQKRYEAKVNLGAFWPGRAFAPEDRETAVLFKMEFRASY